MNLTITKEAMNYIEQYRHSPEDKLSFVYAHMGCTCSEEGIFSLRFTPDIPKDATAVIHSNFGDIHIDPSKINYLDREMTLKYNVDFHALQLSGKYEGLINPRIMLVDNNGHQLMK